MAEKTINDWTAEASPVSADYVPIWDTSAGASRKVLVSDLSPVVAGSLNLSELQDVTITTIAANEVLVWNGSAWINQTLTEAGIAPIADPTFTGEIGIGAVNVSETELGILEGATLTTTELNYVDGVTSAIQTQLDGKVGGSLVSNLNLNDYALTRTETAGEILANGDLAYLKSDGKYWKADASAESTASTDILMCTEAISADATGTFIEYGEYTTTGLTAGSNYYISETAGAITTTAPSTSTSIVRIVGTALSTTVLKFKPDVTYVEVA